MASLCLIFDSIPVMINFVTLKSVEFIRLIVKLGHSSEECSFFFDLKSFWLLMSIDKNLYLGDARKKKS